MPRPARVLPARALPARALPARALPARGLAALALAGAALLAGCTGGLAPGVAPLARPDFDAVSAPDTGASARLADYYQRVQNGLLAQGLMRTDGGGPDTPFTTRDLVRDFIKVALYEEYSNRAGQLVAREKPSTLHRWQKPVTVSIAYGASVGPEKRSRTREELKTLVARLARISGHPMRVVSDRPANFRVFVVNEDERRALAPALTAFMPDISHTALNTVLNLPRSTYCLAFATDPQDDGTYDKAVAVIRAEHPPLMTASCLQEEVTQGMGLSNDYPLARPSIFNDDEEFAFLTHHDELLLKMLYDPRLRPGMTEAEARPIIRQIAAKLMGGAV